MKPALFSVHRLESSRYIFSKITAALLLVGIFSLNDVFAAPKGDEQKPAAAVADNKAKQEKVAQKPVAKVETKSRPGAKGKGKANAKAGAKGKAEAGKAQKLITQTFLVEPSFFSTTIGSVADRAADPFAADSTAARGSMSPKQVLELVGITFGEGANARYNAKSYELTVINTSEQIDMVELYVVRMMGEREKQIHILVEFIEVEHAWFSEWLFENRLDSDGTPLRRALQELVREGDATIIDSSMITARSGQRAKTESVLEFIYPTEYEPSKIPEEVELSDRAEAPITPVSPAAFETRNVGTTLEVDPVLGRDNTTIDLNLAPEIVAHDGYSVWPSEEVDPGFQSRMPTFYTMRFSTQVTVTDGNYGLLGTVRPKEASQRGVEDPIVIGFVRGDVGIVPLAIPRK